MAPTPVYPCFLHTSFGVDFRNPRVDLGFDGQTLHSMQVACEEFGEDSKWDLLPLTPTSCMLIASGNGNGIQYHTRSQLGGLAHKLQFAGDRARRAGLKKLNGEAWLWRVDLGGPDPLPACFIIQIAK